MKKLLLSSFSVVMIFMACSESADKPETAPGVGEAGTSTADALGQKIYASKCVICHRADGKGLEGSIPPLNGSDFLKDREASISTLLKGLSGPITVNGVSYNGTMPDPGLDDQEIADVLTYVNQSFGNNEPAVSVDEVVKVKENVK